MMMMMVMRKKQHGRKRREKKKKGRKEEEQEEGGEDSSFQSLSTHDLPALYYLLNRFNVRVLIGKAEGEDFRWQKSMRRNILCVGVCRIVIGVFKV